MHKTRKMFLLASPQFCCIAMYMTNMEHKNDNLYKQYDKPSCKAIC